MQATLAYTGISRSRSTGSARADRPLASSRSFSSLPLMARWSRATPARSWLRVVMATPHPPLSGPSRVSRGTTTSLKNSSEKVSSPAMVLSGRTSIPGEVMSTRRQLSPLCLGTSGSVRT